MEEKQNITEEKNETLSEVEMKETQPSENVVETENIPTDENQEKINSEISVEEVKETVVPLEEKQILEEIPSNEKTKIASAPMDDFDWDAYEKGDIVSSEAKKELEKVYDNTLNAIKDKEVIEGTVIAINKREVVVNVGYKSDGVIPTSEFRYNPDLKVGDKVEVYIESQEDKKGQLVLSHKQARVSRAWERVNEALESQEIVKGYIKCRTKGGMIVDVFGIEAFLPGSQIDVKPIRDYDAFVNKTMEFKVVKINQEFRNVVVSHKAIIEEELEQQKKEIISKLEKGQILEGTVKNITSYGVFIDLGGVDGLIHITDLSWGRINHPSEIVSLDQKLNVVILDFDEEKKRIALGLKQLTPHPWDSLDPNLKIGDKVKGKVVVLTDYGAFVEIAPGVEGLIHVSEMSWSQHLRSAQDFLKVGDEVEAIILTLDREERKMSLGIKQLKSDPWENIEERYPVGSKHVAKVRNFTNFGVFVEIEEGVDGLIHISDLSWTKKVKHPSEFTQIGSDIEVVVLEIDKENRRLSLGHKQLEENPWEVLETIFTVGSVHEGIVVEFLDKGAIIALPYGVEGFATTKHLIKEDGSQAQVDEKLPFKVIEFNKDAKKIVLSHTRVYEDLKREEKAKVAETEDETTKKTLTKRSKKKEVATTPSIEKTTLGDIQSLAELKDQLDNEEATKQAEQEEKKATKAKKTKTTKTSKEKAKAEELSVEEETTQKEKQEEVVEELKIVEAEKVTKEKETRKKEKPQTKVVADENSPENEKEKEETKNEIENENAEEKKKESSSEE